DKKISSSHDFDSGKANLLDKVLEQQTSVTQQESQLDDELTDISDSEIGNTSNEIQITLIHSENMTKLFPEVPSMSASDVSMRDAQTTDQVSSELKVKAGLSHSTSEIRHLEESLGRDMNNTSSDKSPCCLHSWVYSLYGYGPKCTCGNAGKKDNTKSDLSTESSMGDYVDTNKASYSTPINSNLKEQMHSRKTSNEDTLSFQKKGIKRPHSPAVNAVKCIRTVDVFSPLNAQPTLVEHNNLISVTGNSAIYKKKSKLEYLMKSKNENRKKKSRIKHQPMTIVALTPSQVTSKVKDDVSQKVSTEKVVPVPNCPVPELGDKSCNKDSSDTQTYEKMCKEKKKRKRLILNSQFTVPHGSPSPSKNKKDQAQYMRLDTIDANGLKLHCKSGKAAQKDKEKVLNGSSPLWKEEQSTSLGNSPPGEDKTVYTFKYDKNSKARLGSSSPRKKERLSVSNNDKMSKASPGSCPRKEGKSSVNNINKKSKVSSGSSSPRKAEKSPTYDYEKKSRVSPGNFSSCKEKTFSGNDKMNKALSGHSPPRKEQCFINANIETCKASPGNPLKNEQYSNRDNDKNSKASSGISLLRKEQCSTNCNDKKSKASPSNSPPKKEEQSSMKSNDKMSKVSPGNYSSGCEAKSPSSDSEKKSKASLGSSSPSGGEISYKIEYGVKSIASPTTSSKKEEKYFADPDPKSKPSSGNSPFRTEDKPANVYERNSKSLPSKYHRDDADSPCSQERNIKAPTPEEETSTNTDYDKNRRGLTVGAFLGEEKLCPTAGYEKRNASSPADEAKYNKTGTEIRKSNEKRV
ncbi:hypothetical protein NDU88_006159, partial [Pleurodeles waltl]